MKKLALMLAGLSLLGLGCLNSSGTKPPARPSVPATLSGVVTMVVTNVGETARVLTGVDQDTGATVDVEVQAETGIAKLGKPADYTAFHLGETVLVKGVHGANGTLLADTIEVTAEPEIAIALPLEGDQVGSPLHVLGAGRAFESQANWRIKDAAGKVLSTGWFMFASPDQGMFGLMDFDIFLPQLADKNFILEIFESSAKDGFDTNVTSRRLSVEKTDTTVVKVFFANNGLNPGTDCGAVFPQERTFQKTGSVARLALTELLTGLREQETAQGYSTLIPEYVRLNSIRIEDGVAYADFSALLDMGVAGACRVTAIRSQIEETLKQFASVKDVVISVEGRTDDILQP